MSERKTHFYRVDVWMYAVKPGWQLVAVVETRHEARDFREDDDGALLPRGWMSIRREGAPRPTHTAPNVAIPEPSPRAGPRTRSTRSPAPEGGHNSRAPGR